jgi:FlaA1/EpsC-like NDP-sugar epimerase
LSSPSDIKRYFISPAESGQLCLLACIVAQSGEVVFPVLNPEKDLKNFSDIAVALLHSLHLEPSTHSSEEEAKNAATIFSFENDRNYPVYFFKSDTSGEKSFEEFSTDDEESLNFQVFENLGIVENAKSMNRYEAGGFIEKLVKLFEENATKEELIYLLKQVVPNFHHIEKAKNLDQKM